MADGQQIVGALVEDLIATPATPAAGKAKLYPKADKLWYALNSDGTEELLSNKAPTQTVLTGAGTYTSPTGCKAFRVRGVAGGGSGGGVGGSATQAGGGGGGASGGYFEKMMAAGSYAYTVGAGAAPAAAGFDGNTGNDTTFGSGGTLLTAKAGEGGNAGPLGTTALANSVARGGRAGAISTDASGGVSVLAGGTDGGYGIRTSATLANGGAGGSGPWGGGGPIKQSDGNGNDGRGPGSGGGGAAVQSVNTARAGGRGSDGTIIIDEYY